MNQHAAAAVPPVHVTQPRWRSHCSDIVMSAIERARGDASLGAFAFAGPLIKSERSLLTRAEPL